MERYSEGLINKVGWKAAKICSFSVVLRWKQIKSMGWSGYTKDCKPLRVTRSLYEDVAMPILE